MCSFPKLDDSCHYFIWLIILTSDECITVFAEQSGKTMEKYGNMWKKMWKKSICRKHFALLVSGFSAFSQPGPTSSESFAAHVTA